MKTKLSYYKIKCDFSNLFYVKFTGVTIIYYIKFPNAFDEL